MKKYLVVTLCSLAIALGVFGTKVVDPENGQGLGKEQITKKTVSQRMDPGGM